MGEMRRATEWEEQQRRKQDRFASTIVIAASIIAADPLHVRADALAWRVAAAVFV